MNINSNLIVGLVALSLLPMIALRIRRGLRDGCLPVYRTSLMRAESPSKFGLLLALHVSSFVLIALVAIDLFFKIGLRDGP